MSVPRISPKEALAKMNDEGYAYVDVRTEEEFAAGHPAGALNVPFLLAGPNGREPNPDFFDVMEKLYAKDARLVLGCQTGNRSLKAAKALAERGFSCVIDQRAGWAGVRGSFGELVEEGWTGAGLPAETGATAGHSYPDVVAKIRS